MLPVREAAERAPFVHHKEYVDLIERIDCLHGDVVGIARTNTDDENLSHLQESSTQPPD
jgi:hypothetical protein